MPGPSPRQQVEVAERPDRPLLVFDGDCGFCRRWVERWKAITGDRVLYRPTAEVVEYFPEIGGDGFASRVWLIEPDGRARGGAAAVLRLYNLAGEKHLTSLAYDRLPGFANLAESSYDLVASHREAAARPLFLSGRIIDAGEARAAGLVNRVVPPAALDEAVESEVAHFLPAFSGAIARAKALARALGMPITDAVIADVVERLADSWETEEARSGIAAFFERRGK